MDGTNQLITPPEPLFAICGPNLVKIDYLRTFPDGHVVPFRMDLSKRCLIEIEGVESLKTIQQHDMERDEEYRNNPELRARSHQNYLDMVQRVKAKQPVTAP